MNENEVRMTKEVKSLKTRLSQLKGEKDVLDKALKEMRDKCTK